MRPIDADALLHALATQTMNNGKTDDMRKGVFAALEYCRQLIEMQSTISQPMRYGRWIYSFSSSMRYYRCTSCDCLANENEIQSYIYCPCCGARMDGGADT